MSLRPDCCFLLFRATMWTRPPRTIENKATSDRLHLDYVVMRNLKNKKNEFYAAA